uniref:Uncharacterized protein n=1 Tax=Glossina austeni TaxID=7395 RepID=A0A1A9UGP2_GLOAU
MFDTTKTIFSLNIINIGSGSGSGCGSGCGEIIFLYSSQVLDISINWNKKHKQFGSNVCSTRRVPGNWMPIMNVEANNPNVGKSVNVSKSFDETFFHELDLT